MEGTLALQRRRYIERQRVEGSGKELMTGYKESGVELVQARGQEGRFEYQGLSLRLGLFHDEEGWYIGVHMSSGRMCARLSLEYARSQKEAKDMLKYGFFLRTEEAPELVEYMESIGLLSVPVRAALEDPVEDPV